MSNESDNKFEKRVRFVAKHYKEGRLDADKAWKQFACKQEITPRRVSLRKYLIGAAAVMLMLVGFGTLYILDTRNPEWITVSTLPGCVKDVYLPDSSLISLAGNSQIKYDAKKYRKEERAIQMNGKAFFQVQRDPARPFSVNTRQARVVVLGTSFQLNEENDQTTLHVATGKVQFIAENSNESSILTAGMSASYSMNKESITLSSEEESNYLSWKTKQLSFHETALDRVIEDISNCYQVRIMNQTNTSGVRLTATFNDLPLEEVLLIINQTLDTRLIANPDN